MTVDCPMCTVSHKFTKDHAVPVDAVQKGDPFRKFPCPLCVNARIVNDEDAGAFRLNGLQGVMDLHPDEHNIWERIRPVVMAELRENWSWCSKCGHPLLTGDRVGEGHNKCEGRSYERNPINTPVAAHAIDWLERTWKDACDEMAWDLKGNMSRPR